MTTAVPLSAALTRSPLHTCAVCGYRERPTGPTVAPHWQRRVRPAGVYVSKVVCLGGGQSPERVVWR